jgi:hypothetical protein
MSEIKPNQPQEMRTRVGEETIITIGTPEEHIIAVHEATLKLRTPEQIAKIEQNRAAFVENLNFFTEVVKRNFEESGNQEQAIDDALFDAFNLNLRQSDDF